MNIVSVRQDPGTKQIVFERNGFSVTKVVQVSNRDEKRLISKAMREADRDLAFMEHGEDFRKHCEFQDNFWDCLPEHVIAQVTAQDRQ